MSVAQFQAKQVGCNMFLWCYITGGALSFNPLFNWVTICSEIVDEISKITTFSMSGWPVGLLLACCCCPLEIKRKSAKIYFPVTNNTL